MLSRYTDRYSLIDDLEIEYGSLVDERNRFYATIWYFMHIIRVAPTLLYLGIYWRLSMFKNYFKIAFRNMRKNKTYSLINIGGLAIGMAASLIIILFVMTELSFDKFHEKADRIYRIGNQIGPTVDTRGAFTPPPLAFALKNDFPEIIEVTRINLWKRNRLVRYRDQQYIETDIIHADSTVFNIFTFQWMAGNPKNALVQPDQVVITDRMAAKYFGNEEPVGKILEFEDRDVMVCGVVKAFPENSHFQFDFIRPMVALNSHDDLTWMSHCYFTYLLLPEEYPPEQLENKFPDFILRHYGPVFLQETGVDYQEYLKVDNNYYGYWLQPLLDIHLNNDIYYLTDARGSRQTVLIFSTIALFILIIACINFINLSTARSEKRAREVGIRKVLGTNRGPLFIQFFSESIMMCGIALIIALCMIYTALPSFNMYLNRDLGFYLVENPIILGLFLGFAILVGVGAGMYPALYLTSFQPVRVLKGRIFRSRKGLRVRNGLVVFQFLISILLIIGTLVIDHQLRYVHHSELGFEQDQIVVVNRCRELGEQKPAFKQGLLQNPDILVVSNTNSAPGRHFEPNSYVLNGRPTTEDYLFWTMFADYEYVKLLDLELLYGRYFSQTPAGDEIAVVINETAVKEHRLENPIGQMISMFNRKGRVIGVVKDFHFQSLHHQIGPMMIAQLQGFWGENFCIKVRPDNIRHTIDTIRDQWHAFTGGKPFQYSFLNQEFQQLYEADQKTGTLLLIFSCMAILIACLGIFGLAAATSEQRTKEVGIRKVVGASVKQILFLLVSDVVKWVCIAFIVGTPVAYYIMGKWLQNFAYRTSLSWWIFALTGAGTMIIAFLTVSWQTICTARANPVDTLRYE